jgi:S-(hydroxymethyl)glutathione dehydrogenase / alcohol dehydrogenase
LPGLTLSLHCPRLRPRTAQDINPAKFDLARELGGDAVVCLNPNDAAHGGKPAAQLIVDMTKTAEDAFGGADYSFECVGSTALMRAALECTHRGWGQSVIIGVAASGQEIATRPFQLVTGRVWKGTAFGGVKGATQLPALTADYMAGKLPLDKFITHRYDGVGKLNEAFHVMHDPAAGALRPVITY